MSVRARVPGTGSSVLGSIPIQGALQVAADLADFRVVRSEGALADLQGAFELDASATEIPQVLKHTAEV